MLKDRLTLAAERGLLTGPVLVIGARANDDLSDLPGSPQIIQGMKPDHDALQTAGHDVRLTPEGRFASAVVVLPRAKALARDRIARASAVTDGPILVDGQKTDGVESLLKDVRRRGATTGEVISKAHGKIFAILDGDFDDWRQEPARNAHDFLVPPGGFSADEVDPGSALLAAALPDKLSGRVVDLGAGWGYLSRMVLGYEAVTHCALVEADHASLDCARQNITDPRAGFHWQDARGFRPEAAADHVVMNPPFHQGRDADPDLGRAFIDAAAASLTPSGHLWLVANRHLPYEGVLEARFGYLEELPGAPAYKLYHAARPRKSRR
ncbi:hypothetical protein LCGC14_1617150 [marine sediment metagenome]|uniref:Methyltransferase small domain-containing protein n=1 Tax=marine sediment metagenome TaxID=412755 RepID=A0A0F9ITE1_9ZZZZ